jgi:hypothetical protein
MELRHIGVGRCRRPDSCSKLPAAMFCPQCQAEYRQGFTRCSDCDVDLVHHLEPRLDTVELGTGELDDREADLQLIWKGHEESECVRVCRNLLKADIPYKVAQIIESTSTQMRVIKRYEIGVPKADCERARALLGIEGEFANAGDAVDEFGEDDSDEADGPESFPLDDSPPDETVRNDRYLRPWYPEDAIVEIWSQQGADISSGIQMVLKEHLIHCRLDLDSGTRKVFVATEDEARAREIVREMVNGAPPA